MSTYQLDQEQLASFRRSGYIVLRANEHHLLQTPTDLQTWSDEVRNWPLEESRGKWMPYFEDTPAGDRQIMRTEKFMDYHTGLRHLLQGDGLLSILKQLSTEVGLQNRVKSDDLGYALVQRQDQLQAAWWQRIRGTSRCAGI